MLNQTAGMEETQRRKPQSAPEPSRYSVEHLLEAEHPGALILRHREEAKQSKGNQDPRKAVVIGSRSDAAKVLLNDAKSQFTVLDFVRSDHMIWARAENAASLPLGCLFWSKWLSRLAKLEVLPPMERPWTYEGRTMKNTLVVRMTMGVDKGNTSINAAVHHMSPPRPIHSLGTLRQPPGEDQRTEIVVETTADEARDMRTKNDIFQIGGWRKASDGKVATTFDLPEKQIEHKRTISKNSLHFSINNVTASKWSSVEKFLR